MYGETLVELLLKEFSLEEILEMNNLTEEEVLQLLIDGGLIGEPERFLREFEEEATDGID